MAEKEASLLLRLKDEASKGLGVLRGNILAVVAAVGSLIAFTGSVIKDALESEQATNKLNIALKNQGIFTQELSKEMQAYASQLQKTSTFSDEAILHTQSLLTTFGLAGIELKKATQAALDLSKGLGIDLNTATLLLGKSFQGETGALSRYGIIIDDTIPKAQKFDAVLSQLNQRFGGEAQAATQTLTGRIEVLNNAISDIKENIGSAILPVLEFFVQRIHTVVQAMQEWGGVFNTLKILGLEFSKELIGGIILAIEQIPILGDAFKLLDIDLEAVNASIDEQIMKMTLAAQEENRIGEERLLNQQIRTNTSIQIEKRRQTEQLIANKKMRSENTAMFEAIMADEHNAIKVRNEIQAKANEARLAAMQDVFGRIAALQDSSNKDIAKAAKAAAIFLITIDTFRAASGARAALSGIPIIGPALGNAAYAAILASGFAQVAQITGMKLAEGGLIMPRAGGIPAIVGEGGNPEVVIPLEDERTKDKLADIGFGGTEINLQVGVLIGSENNVRELAKMIDQELFTLRRNNESIALGAL